MLTALSLTPKVSLRCHCEKRSDEAIPVELAPSFVRLP